jgi:formate hydrogenlyase subunit 4
MTTPNDEQSGTNKKQYAFNLTLAAVAGQVGCLTLIVILIALFLGMWLDTRIENSYHVFTLILLAASVPVTIVLMFWVVRSATSRIRPSAKPRTKNSEEE